MYCFIDLHIGQHLPRLRVIEQEEEEEKQVDMCLCSLCAAYSHILLDQVIRQPAYNLINLFYVGEYCNPVGCLLILFTPTLQSPVFSSQWHICWRHLWNRCQGWKAGVPTNKTQVLHRDYSFLRQNFNPSLTDDCRPLCQVKMLAVFLKKDSDKKTLVKCQFNGRHFLFVLQLRSACFTECILNLFSFKKGLTIHVFVKVTPEICPP